MKFATHQDGSRDGTLLLVSRDLTRAVKVADVATTLQALLEDWASLAPALEKRYAALNDGTLADAFDLDMKTLHSPLPRAYQWADGSAYLN
ncbi:fumarylacetoacetate hydrolase family protein, partial [Cobetia marina]